MNAEIDVVAYDGLTLCFVEVKTRESDDFAAPQVNVDLRKRRQIARAALAYRRLLGLVDAAYRYDVVTVVAKSDGSEPRIELLKGFWSDAQLKKAKAVLRILLGLVFCSPGVHAWEHLPTNFS